MATTAISGKNGSVTTTGGTGSVDANAEVTEWNADIDLQLLESTSFASSGNREYVAGLAGGSGSLTAVASAPVTGSVDTLQLDAGTTTGDLRYSGAAIITKVGNVVPVGDLVSYTADFTFTGAITKTTVP